MKLINTLIIIAFSAYLSNTFSQNNSSPVFHCDAYSIYNNHVIQGKYTAQALSADEMQSDYQSQATAFKSPVITFKFSINGLDNEMLPGINHEFVCLNQSDTCVTPLITFGKRYVDNTPIPANTYLKPNTMFRIRLDMRPVLEQFEKNGYFTNYAGIKIYKSDFKGVWVVGNNPPMVWNFDNLTYHDDLKLSDPDGDGIYEIVVKINPQEKVTNPLRTWKLSKNINAFPQYKTTHLLENAIYNMSLEEMEKAIEKDSTLRTGIDWPGVWTRDVSYSIILSMAYLQPKVSENSLMRKVNANGRIIQDTGTGGAWPNSTDRMIWAVAAWEIYKVTGDNNWLKKVYPIIKNSIDDDLMVDHDKATGLVKGESSFLDWREQTYPRWMQPVDIFQSKNLGTNALHYKALTVLSQMAFLMNERQAAEKYKKIAGEVKSGINKYLWLADKNYYGQYLYGRNYQQLSPRSEALGEALSVVFDVANPGRQKQVVQNVPIVNYGIPCIYPQIGDIPPYHNNAVWPFVQTYWLWAAAKTGNEDAVMHSIAAIYRASALFLTNKENFVADNGDWAGTQINSSNMLWSLSGNLSVVLKVIFGARFDVNGLSFQPFVPQAMADTRTLTNFRYRNANFDIELSGFGNKIESFLLDGAKQKSAFVPSTITGKHSIKIVLNNQSPKTQTVNLVKNAFTPLMPVPDFKSGKLKWNAIDGAVSYTILKDAENWQETTENSIEIPTGETGEFQIVATDRNGLNSFASEPVAVYPDNAISIFETENVITPSTLPYHNFSGRGFVEISRTVNRDITMEIEVPSDGFYAIDWRYANGNGPINTENKCAIRSLFIDGKFSEAQIFPQRGTDEWSNWGFSNAVKAKLKKGKHTLKLEFLPSNENMNIEINQAMLDYVRLVKIK